jgi:hypothetical protein
MLLASLEDGVEMSLDDLIEFSSNLRSERQKRITKRAKARVTQELEEIGTLHECELCGNGKSFKDEQGLMDHHNDKHILNDTDSDLSVSFNCEECEKNFQNKEGLRDHIKDKHAPVTSSIANCKECCKTFQNKVGLEDHIKDKHAPFTSPMAKKRKMEAMHSPSTVPPKRARAKLVLSRVCDNCQNIGHLWSQCPFDNQCLCCGSTKHLKMDCPHSAKMCSACHHVGHLRLKCRHC